MTTQVKQNGQGKKLGTLQRVITEILSRTGLARRLGFQYNDKRKLYEALGYPDEKDLTFEWYFNKYDRQDIANAIIDRPADATWSGAIDLVEKGKEGEESELSKQWLLLNKRLKVKQRLCKIDKLSGIGQFALLLFGFDDVKQTNDFTRPLTGTRRLLYLKQVAESEVDIHEFETNTSNERFGLPKFYRIKVGSVESIAQPQAAFSFQEIIVHHSRVLHILTNNLTSEIYGRPRLKPIANRLIDLEKILGGDAEMFWRGARPGYQAAAQPDYEMSDDELKLLEDELDKYEHDLRRFISAKGVDIKALEQQISDPITHIDIQLQAISAQTGIPKRILIGSERGELSSGQDRDQWLAFIKMRMEDESEPDILRPFIDKCMEVGVLPKVDDYTVVWEDIFAPSEVSKVDIGKKRSEALRVYAESPFASDILPPELAYKYLLGLNEEQVREAMKAFDEGAFEEVKDLRRQQPSQIQRPNGTNE